MAAQVATRGAVGAEDAGVSSRAQRIDWLVAALSIWLVTGFYVDLWAHSHGVVDDTFLTPYHALLYSGAASFTIALWLIAIVRLAPEQSVRRALSSFALALTRRPATAPWAIRALVAAVPAGYAISFAGSVLFIAAGAIDFAWHSIVGFEVDVETLLSPPHLLLASAGVLMVAGPLRSVWYRAPERLGRGWAVAGPVVVSLTLIFAIFAAFTQYANPVTDPWSERQPGVGADGVTDSPTQVFAMAPDGTAQRRVTTTADTFLQPRLSRDGEALAFMSIVDGNGQVFLAEPDGTRAHPITPTDEASGRASWSPDGSTIVLESSMGDGPDFDLWLADADGTNLRPLTDDPAQDWNPAWSPDGTKVAFNTDRRGGFDIAILDVATGESTVLEDSGNDHDPTWSPDGTALAFASDRAGDFELWAVTLDSRARRQLTDDPRGASFVPAWSPDGSTIVFTTNRDGDFEVYATRPDGTDQRNLSRSPGTDDGWGLSWTPDGDAIIYPSTPPTPFWRAPFVRQGWGAAGILVHAALIAGFALVALRRGPLPKGALVILLAAPTLMMAPVVEQWRIVPGALVAGIVAEVLVRLVGFGETRARDVIVAFAVPAIWFAAYFTVIAATSGMGWSVTLWTGGIFLAGIVGVLINEVSRAGLGQPRDTPYIAVG